MSALTESNSDLIHIVWIQDGQQNKNQQQNNVYKYSDENCLFYSVRRDIDLKPSLSQVFFGSKLICWNYSDVLFQQNCVMRKKQHACFRYHRVHLEIHRMYCFLESNVCMYRMQYASLLTFHFLILTSVTLKHTC